MTVTVEEATQQARSNAWQVVGRRRPKWMKKCSFKCALSRTKIYVLGTTAVIICAACITIPLVLNQKSHSSNPNNSTSTMGTTMMEPRSTAPMPTTLPPPPAAGAAADAAASQPDSPVTSPPAEATEGAQNEPAGDQTNPASHDASPADPGTSKHPEPSTQQIPETTPPTTYNVPAMTNAETQHPSSPVNQHHSTQPDEPEPQQPHHSSQPDHNTEPDRNTQPDHSLQPDHSSQPDQRHHTHDHVNGAATSQGLPESTVPMNYGYPNGETGPAPTGAA